MGQVQLSDRQSSFIFYLVHQGKGRTEAALLAGFAAPRQSAFTLTQSPKIIAKIRQERNKVYQTELASKAVQTLKEVISQFSVGDIITIGDSKKEHEIVEVKPLKKSGSGNSQTIILKESVGFETNAGMKVSVVR